MALDALPPDLAAAPRRTSRWSSRTSILDEPDIFGLFEEAPYLPAKVTIYRRPLEEDFGHDPEELERRDPDHRPPRAGPLLRDRRGPARRARLPVTSAAERRRDRGRRVWASSCSFSSSSGPGNEGRPDTRFYGHDAD